MSGLKKLVVVACLAVAAPSLFAAAPADVVSLFNGTNLDGWVVMNAGNFSATNGCIRIAGGMGWLRTERVFTNFVLEAEWRGLETNYNSGIFIRCGKEGNPFPTNAWQVNLKQADLGAWLKNKDIKFSPKADAIPVGQWAKYKITAHGTNVTVELNGRELWRSGFDATGGFIGIQAEGKEMEIRNLRLRKLPAEDN